MSDESKKWPFLYDYKGWNAEAERQDDGTWKVVIFDGWNPKREYESIEAETEQEAIHDGIVLFKAWYKEVHG